MEFQKFLNYFQEQILLNYLDLMTFSLNNINNNNIIIIIILVMENEKATILWDYQVKTDRHIPCNMPDIIIQEKDSERCLIIDVAIPSDYNIQKKAIEKMSKYVDLQIECQRMCNKKVEAIPIIIGATGIVEKGIQSYLQKIPGKHNLYNLQRSAILGTAHILRKVLSIKPD